jgi:hypothetical protein
MGLKSPEPLGRNPINQGRIQQIGRAKSKSPEADWNRSLCRLVYTVNATVGARHQR